MYVFYRGILYRLWTICSMISINRLKILFYKIHLNISYFSFCYIVVYYILYSIYDTDKNLID